jgi:hypothetical protein
VICSRCRCDLPATVYSRRTDRPKGCASFCPACRREASKEWYRRSQLRKGKAVKQRRVLPHVVTDGPALLKLVRVTLRQAFVWRDREAFLEAVQEGALAALQAAQRLDAQRGDAVAYLRQRIRGSAQDGFRKAADVTRSGAKRVRFVTGLDLDAYCA